MKQDSGRQGDGEEKRDHETTDNWTTGPDTGGRRCREESGDLRLEKAVDGGRRRNGPRTANDAACLGLQVRAEVLAGRRDACPALGIGLHRVSHQSILLGLAA